MALFFLQESKEKNKFKLKLKKILNKIEENSVENKVFITLPIEENVTLKKTIKIGKKLDKYNIKNAVLSEELYKIEILKNFLYSRNINILDGRYLFKLLSEEIIYYISKKMGKNIEKLEISILTNDANYINKEIIMNLAEKVKTLNIITNHINEFRKIEDSLYKEKGIIVKISNNYKTALQKTNIIINIDFPEEIINKYLIPTKCIIVDIKGGVKIKTKKFNGININGYNIIIPEKYKIKGYNNKFVYESCLINKDYKTARKQILEDKIQIENLIGENGKINNKEFSFFP